MKGMELGLIHVPHHNIMLDCELVQGILLLLGCAPHCHMTIWLRFWAMTWLEVLCGLMCQSLVIISKPLASVELDKSGQSDPGVLPVCTVTHAQSPSASAPDLPDPGVFLACVVTCAQSCDVSDLDLPVLGCSKGVVTAEHAVSLHLPAAVSREE